LNDVSDFAGFLDFFKKNAEKILRDLANCEDSMHPCDIPFSGFPRTMNGRRPHYLSFFLSQSEAAG